MDKNNLQDAQQLGSKAISDDELDQVSGGTISIPMYCKGCGKLIYSDSNGNFSCTCGWHS